MSFWLARSTRRAILVATVGPGLWACGGDDQPADDGSAAPTEASAVTDATTTERVPTTIGQSSTEVTTTSGDPAGSGDDGAPPDVDTGTVTIAGTSFELTGPSRTDVMLSSDFDADASAGEFDFEICETVNPAFAGEFNIAGTLGDDTSFAVRGTIDEPPDADDGLVLGDLPDEERVTFDEIALDGRTISGSATTSRGAVEFSFTC